ncbi:MAG: hypothetical protein FH751_09605 [Firmicutes bacterium]|nr:hypothetical protein [Bacillota bacterium]
MSLRLLKDKGILNIIIALLCLIILFMGFNIAIKVIGSKDSEKKMVNKEVISVYNINKDFKELKSTELKFTNENQFEGDFFLSVILKSNNYMELAYEKNKGSLYNINIFNVLFENLFSNIEPKSYLKSQLPAILNIIKSKEDEETKVNIDKKKETKEVVAPLVDEYEVKEDVEEYKDVEVIEDIVIVDPNISSNTNISKNVNIEKIKSKINMPKPLEINNTKPYILIYHTHATEVYLPITKDNYHSTKREFSVIKIGDVLKEELNKYNHKVKHVDIYHDLPSYKNSYVKSLSTARREIKSEKNLKILIDIHRDGIPLNSSYLEKAKKESKIQINGKSVATFRLVIGDDTPNKGEVLKFAKYIKAVSDQMYPGLCKGIIIKPYGKYNLFLSDYSTLFEVGSNLTTIDESVETAKYLAEILDNAIKGIKK